MHQKITKCQENMRILHLSPVVKGSNSSSNNNKGTTNVAATTDFLAATTAFSCRANANRARDSPCSESTNSGSGPTKSSGRQSCDSSFNGLVSGKQEGDGFPLQTLFAERSILSASTPNLPTSDESVNDFPGCSGSTLNPPSQTLHRSNADVRAGGSCFKILINRSLLWSN